MEAGGDAGEGPEQAEEEVYRRLEEEVAKLRVEDVLLQSVVSILNLSARRILKDDERDLEQARLGIDAVRALAEVMGEGAAPVRDALSEVQLLFARHAKGTPSEAEGGETAGEQGGEPSPGQGGAEGDRGPDDPRSRLWVPPGT